MATEKYNEISIVGGGPVGALHACYLSKRGYHVDLYESRDDIRKIDFAAGRSINLALSRRGIDALQHIGLSEEIVSLGIPMHSRMIHFANGKCKEIPYGKKGEYLLSVSRFHINQRLIGAAADCANVKMHFRHKLTSCDLDEPTLTFRREDGTEERVRGGMVFGCDGAYSRVREQMRKRVFDYSQHYIPHAYKELTIPASDAGEYKMPKPHLHIWPRHEYMMIALPNRDKSFTCTLFMPFSVFEPLTDGDKVVEFFQQIFPDALPLIGEKRLREDYFLLPPLPLVTVKCSPYHYKHTTALLGDAAHAVVPFFGQGLNASLEDVLVFDGLMEKHDCDFGKVLPEYSQTRTPDGQAIADLSAENYIEMRSTTATWWFLFRKKIDNLLNEFFPSHFQPKYSMVAFTRTRYHEVVKRAHRQDQIVHAGLTLVGAVLVWAIMRIWGHVVAGTTGEL